MLHFLHVVPFLVSIEPVLSHSPLLFVLDLSLLRIGCFVTSVCLSAFGSSYTAFIGWDKAQVLRYLWTDLSFLFETIYMFSLTASVSL